MFTEIAIITIDPARAGDFEAAIAAAAPLFREAQGCHGMALERTVEDAAKYRLLVQWENVEDHMVTFRNSDAFQQWRALAGPFFVGAPTVEHSETVATHFWTHQ
jgi:quinol monooxygenase YgiN